MAVVGGISVAPTEAVLATGVDMLPIVDGILEVLKVVPVVVLSAVVTLSASG